MKNEAFVAREVELVRRGCPRTSLQPRRPRDAAFGQNFFRAVNADRSFSAPLASSKPRRGADVTNLGESLYDEV
jgi:hypothetical protein